MNSLKEEALQFLKDFRPPMKNQKQLPIKERTYAYGVVNAIISHYSVKKISLFENENMVDRCTTGFKYMEEADISPYKDMDAIYIIFNKKTPTNNKYDIVIDLMLGFVEYLKEK